MERLRVLAIGAHPDDIEFGCFGTLCLLSRYADVHALIMSSCDEDGWGKSPLGFPIRAAETEEALSAIATTTSVLELTHRELEFPSQKNVQAVEKVLQRVRPNIVFTQGRWDTHQDHRALEQITVSACRRMPVTLLGYHSPSSTGDFVTNAIVDISSIFEEKKTALQKHHSQAGQPYMDEEWLKQWHYSKDGTNVGYTLVELFHLYQAFWPPAAGLGLWR